ncbi:hypothetical protein [Lacrimispora sp.]|uniref:hypothetical protein n=1 Tax=Lacrimispora sp. TaxID=2719234 RepID=UPI0028AAB1A1|nr:hypothetical protein [Lacrimispora sp.]
MKKQLISCFLAMLLAGSCQTGCADSANGVAASGQGGDEVVHLQFWGGIPEDQGPQDTVDAFNASHEKIQVEYIRYTNDDAGNTKLDMSLMAGGDHMKNVKSSYPVVFRIRID